MSVTRRALLAGFATYPLVALVSSPALIAACGSRPPETPLAHLYGKEWVHGAYGLYSSRYADVQTSADASSHDAYRVLAQKGVVALDNLQSREVPFHIRVDADASNFKIARNVPERLMFTADMSDAQRKKAESDWKAATEHIHTDYEEIRRLDWALTRLLAQLQRIRNAIEEGRIEQYRLVEQTLELRKDPTQLPYALPYQVTATDYEEILYLLLERLDDDRARLGIIEADIVAVGMTVRATDANSATLAASIRKVLLAVIEDSSRGPRPPTFPQDEDERQKLLAKGRALAAKIEASPEFTRWRTEEREKRLAALGAFLQVLDQMTGLPTSGVYRTVLDLWRGDMDYLGYLKTVVSFVPRGGAVARTIVDAIEYTEQARRIGGAVVATVKAAEGASPEQLTAAIAAKAEGVVINTGSRFALERVNRQLSFFKDQDEVKKVTELLGESDLVRRAMPSLPVGL
jgi:hypothetical protein